MRFISLPLAGAVTLTLVLAACVSTATPEPSLAESEEPTPTETATATPEPTEIGTPEPTGTATPSPTSEAAFEDPQTCTNDSIGYTVDYPGDWWANELIDPGEDDPGFTPIIACTYFASEPVELQPNAGLPSGIAIQFAEADDAFQTDGERLAEDAVTVDDRDGIRFEDRPRPSAGFVPEGSLVYGYAIEIGDGRYLVATTDNILQEDGPYEESKGVLDAMMETLEIHDQ
jgi:hypothetical protein